MKKNPEILAPVGGEEQLLAAVRSGADAVYFGCSSFNARRNAKNFSDEEFLSAVRYARKRGVKVYVTLNTLIKNSEISKFRETLCLIAKSGADGVIIQDLGVFDIIKNECPEIPIHASTQMAVHNVHSAKLLEKMGFSRIVLARELSIKEIKKIKDSVSCEIEVFVHGAHCMSASGLCYLSSVFGARSGNRGLCAQPCRLNFRNGKREYALSLKDMCLADMINELTQAGVNSLKIEGRMKRPEYVASAVHAYKNALKGEKPDIALLQSVFSRSGFTNGYALGKRDISMFGYRTKDDVLSASSVLKKTANEYRNEMPLIPVNMFFRLKKNQKAFLSISDGVNTAECEGETPVAAINAPVSQQSAQKLLGKLGSTFYYLDKFSCEIDEGLMLKAADINELRRLCCEKLSLLRGKKPPYQIIQPSDSEKDNLIYNDIKETKTVLMFRHFSSMPKTINAHMFILPISEILENIKELEEIKDRLCVFIPTLIYPFSEEELKQDLIKLKSMGINHAYCNNIGAVLMAKEVNMSVFGGALLNITNEKAINVLRQTGVKAITLSHEISFKEIDGIKQKSDCGIVGYGHIPLMHFRCCPLKTDIGCGKCKGCGELTDRKNEKFTVLCENKNYSVMYNNVPLYIGDKQYPKTDFVLLCFTKESKEECLEIIKAFHNKKSLSGKKTLGLYERELL